LPARNKPADHPAVLTKAELQRLRSLRDKKNREALGLFVVEGEKVMGELLAANFPVSRNLRDARLAAPTTGCALQRAVSTD
jgi:TrmH family RNA methyltransferase